MMRHVLGSDDDDELSLPVPFVVGSNESVSFMDRAVVLVEMNASSAISVEENDTEMVLQGQSGSVVGGK